MAARKMSKRSKRHSRRHTRKMRMRKMRGGASGTVNVYLTLNADYTLRNAFTDNPNIKASVSGPSLKIDMTNYKDGKLSAIAGKCVLSGKTSFDAPVFSARKCGTPGVKCLESVTTNPNTRMGFNPAPPPGVLFNSSTNPDTANALVIKDASGNILNADKLSLTASKMLSISQFTAGNAVFSGALATSSLPTVTLPSTVSAPSPATANVMFTLTFV